MSRLIHFLNRARRKQPPRRKKERLPEYRPPQQTDSDVPYQPENILYLAYGSNLCHATFEGGRGIRPLSSANVWVPELELTFDLPGIPYSEPCFANTRFQKRNRTPSSEEDAHAATERTALLANDVNPSEKAPTATNLGWDEGLVGVVYEVTRDDFAHIVATEGGGSSYRDIEVVCHLLPRSGIGSDDDEGSKTAVDPKSEDATFVAHTLLAPDSALHRNGPHRPRNWAQPSPRYLGLLKTGAAEHGLPKTYRTWLAGLQPYVATSARQEVGKWLMVATWFPLILTLFTLQRATADASGRSRPWVAALVKRVFASVWLTYDWVYRPLFGEGERTVQRER